MAEQTPLHFVFYFAAPPDKVWEGFVSPESTRIIFIGAELEVDTVGEFGHDPVVRRQDISAFDAIWD